MISPLLRSTSSLFLLAALIFFGFALTLKSESVSAEEEFASAAHLTGTGAFEESILHWKRADSLFEHAKNFSSQIETEIHLAAAYHALGQTNLAIATLKHAEDLTPSEDRQHVAQIEAALGAIYTLAPTAAEDHRSSWTDVRESRRGTHLCLITRDRFYHRKRRAG